MHENSLFALLLRLPWWVSALAAIGIVAGVRLLVPTAYAVFAALPFAAIAGYAGWRQLRAPSAKRIAATLERLRGMSWDEFSRELEEAYRREGCTVTRLAAAQADFELVQGSRTTPQGSRTTLVACKRWKATRTGVEPLRELEAACRAREPHECIYVAAGEITEQAQAFAAEKKIRLLHGAELAKKIGL